MRLFTARFMRIGGAFTLWARMSSPSPSLDGGRRTAPPALQGQVLALPQKMSGAPDDPALEQIFPSYVQTARR